MDWIFDNLQVIIAIAGAIAYWLNARNKDKAGEPADYDGDGEPDNTPGGGRAMRDHEQSLEQEENNRRAQELIRRLREQRERGEAAPSPASESAPAPAFDGRTIPPFQQPPPMPARDLRREQAEARRAAVEREQAEVLERQRALAEQMAALKARKAAAQREAASQWGGESVPAAATGVARRAGGDAGWLAELRDARSLKKAVVLREVLGTPAGLR